MFQVGFTDLLVCNSNTTETTTSIQVFGRNPFPDVKGVVLS